MSQPNLNIPELDALLESLVSNQLSGEEVNRLQSLLAADESARDHYRRFIGLHVMLEAWSTQTTPVHLPLAKPSESIENPLNTHVSPSPNIQLRRLPISPMWLSVAATLLLAAYFIGLPTLIFVGLDRAWRLAVVEPLRQRATTDVSESKIPPADVLTVATLTNGANCRWQVGGDIVRLRNGLRLLANETLNLVSGTAEITFIDGANVILEGPASFTIKNASHGKLALGKLFAKVPQQAIGFTIATPAAEIIDLGTEFEVEVRPDGNLAIEVYRGQIRVEPDVAGVVAKKPDAILMSEHHQNRMEIIAATGDIVLDQMPSKSIETESRTAKPTQSAANALQVLLNDSPLAVWRLSHATSGIVWNEIGDRNHGVVLGKPSPPGRFDGKDDYVRLPNLVGDNFSIELCVKTTTPGDDQPHAHFGRTLVWADVPGVNPDFAMSISGRRVFFYSRVPTENFIGQRDVVDGRWHHILLTRERNHPQGLKLYVDGVLDVVAASNDLVLNANPHMSIGGAPLELPEMNSRRYFVGDLDNIAVYDRVLTPETAVEHSNLWLKLTEQK